MSRALKIELFLVVVLAAGIFSECGPSKRSGPASPAETCDGASFPGIEANRLVLLQVSAGRSGEAPRPWLQEDLQELLLAQGYQPVPAGSSAAVRIAPACIQSSLEVDLGGAEVAAVRQWKEGRLAAVQLDRLGTSPPASLRDADSAGFLARIEAMRLAAAGRLGDAAQVLQESGLALDQDAALSFRLGRILAAWSGDILATSRAPFWGGEALPKPLGDQAKRLLARARAHLDRAIELDPRAAMAFFDRAKVHELLGHANLAEVDYQRARDLWPAYGEATAALARLRAARNELAGLDAMLEEALLFADPDARSTSSDLWQNLGQVQLQQKEYGAAAESLRQALALAPIGRRARQDELLGLLARAQGASEASAPPPENKAQRSSSWSRRRAAGSNR